MTFILENKKRAWALLIIFTLSFCTIPVLAAKYDSSTIADCKKEIIEMITPGAESFEAIEELINIDISGFNAQTAPLTDGIKTLASSILGIFITIEILTEIERKGDDFRWEDSLKLLLKLLIIKTVVDMTSDLLTAMYSSVGVLMNTIAAEGTGLSFEDAIKNYANNLCDPLDGKSYFLSPLLGAYMWCMLEAFIVKWVLIISGVLVSVIAATRIFQIVMLNCFAPIPMAFCGWSETKDTTKRFLMSYFATCLHGVVIMVIIRVFMVLMSSESIGALSGIMQILVCTIALLKSVMSSSNWSKEIIGAA